jgi:hypothetical protein
VRYKVRKVKRLDKEGRNMERRKKPEKGEERRTNDGEREERMIKGCYVDRQHDQQIMPRLRMRLCCEILATHSNLCQNYAEVHSRLGSKYCHTKTHPEPHYHMTGCFEAFALHHRSIQGNILSMFRLSKVAKSY